MRNKQSARSAQTHKAAQKHKNLETQSSRIYEFMEDSTDFYAPEPTSDDDIDSEAEDLSEFEDEYQADDEFAPEFELKRRQRILPIWMLCSGQIMWASMSFRQNWKLKPREQLRRRLQLLLGFLEREFPIKTPEELLFSLQGFFVQDKQKDSEQKTSAAWLEGLKRVGIVCGDIVIPLKDFRVGKGEGKHGENISVSLPEGIESLWLERELVKHHEENPLDWIYSKYWLLDGLNEFCAKVNKFCADSFGQDENTSAGLGLRQILFSYVESTVQRKRLKGWKEWYAKRRKRYE